MKIIITVLMTLMFLANLALGSTLGELTTKFRTYVAETDTATSFFTNTDFKVWWNLAQHRIVKLGGYIEKKIDIIPDDDSSAYNLPVGFKSPVGAMVRSSGVWYICKPDPFFKSDSAGPRYFVAGVGSDSFLVYYKRNTTYLNDTLRLIYKSDVADLDTTTDTSEVPGDLEGLVIDEAYSYYLQAKQNYQMRFQVWQIIRTDMGVISQKQ
jgi:hypothetical protein